MKDLHHSVYQVVLDTNYFVKFIVWVSYTSTNLTKVCVFLILSFEKIISQHSSFPKKKKLLIFVIYDCKCITVELTSNDGVVIYRCSVQQKVYGLFCGLYVV